MKHLSIFSFFIFATTLLYAQTKFLKHKVKQGENINTIAAKYEADKNYILMLNDFPPSVKLSAGDIVLIRELKPGEEQVTETRDFVESSSSTYTPPAPKAEPARTETISEPARTVKVAAEVKTEVKKVEKTVAVAATTAAPSSDPKAGANAQAGDVVNYNGTIYNVSNDGYHTFEKGQTLYRLSVIYKTPVDKIKALNGLTSNDVAAGTRLKVK
jgi:LysM repeat protein